MKARFLVLFAAVACLLGVMLTVVAGHVRSAVHDWGEANYWMSGRAVALTVVPDPGGEAPTAERSAQVNAELRALLDGEKAIVVLDAQDGDGPRLGLYDPQARFYGAQIIRGRGFQPSDFASTHPSAIVRSDSYLVGREDEYVPDDVAVVGYFDAQSVPFRTEYVYTLFTQENVHGTYYVDAANPAVAAGFERVLTRGGYLVDAAPLDADVWSIVQGEPLTYAYESALLLVYGSAVLLCLNWAAANKRRYLISRLYGARPVSFTWRSLRPAASAAVAGGAVGVMYGLLALQALDTLSVLPRLTDLGVIAVGNGAVLSGLFAASVVAQTASWGRA